MYDVLVIGAGPAGQAAGLYAALNKLKVLVIDKEIPGRENDGFPLFEGVNLAAIFSESLKSSRKNLEFKKAEVVAVEKNVVSFSAETRNGQVLYGKTVIIASGRDPSTGEACVTFDTLTLKDYNSGVKINIDMQTSVPGIFAAGDVVAAMLGDAFTAAGGGARAALAAFSYLNGVKQP